MDLSKIKKGNIYKNYKDLCNELDEPVKGGNGKKDQLEDWERYFEYNKEGYKYKITKVYKEPKLKLSNVKYREIIKALVLDLLIHTESKSNMQISKSKLLKQLDLVNKNYFYAQNKQFKLAAYTNIPIDDIKDFYVSSDNMLKNNIEKALNELKNEAVILFDKITYICKVHPIVNKSDNGEEMVREENEEDNFGDKKTIEIIDGNVLKEYRPASEQEKKHILAVTDYFLDEYVSIIRSTKEAKCNRNIGEIIKYGYGDQYLNDIRKTLKQKYNISYYYYAYDITFNYDSVKRRWRHECKALGTQSKKKQLSQVNNDICDNINYNAEKRQERAYTLPVNGQQKRINLDKRKRRSQEEYLTNEFKLTKLLIDHDAEIISKEMESIHR